MPIDPPAAVGSLAPALTVAEGRALLSWLEPVAADGDQPAGHRFVFSSHDGDSWSSPSTITRGDDFFANWADVPAIAVAEGGILYAHWLAKTGTETYAYSIFLARSADDGETWEPLGKLPDDDTPTEHGFVAWVPEGPDLRAFWLDGRAMTDEGPMALRTARVSELSRPSEVLDARVCECCPVAAVATPTGPVVVYRDRSEEEIRDLAMIRREGEGWSAPRLLHEDGWVMPGCPVNGPAIVAEGERLAAAWFTAAGERQRVQAVFSEDSGETFSPPTLVAEGGVLGRVGLALDGDGGAVVSWLETQGDGAALRLRRILPGGATGEPVSVARTASSRASGVPRVVRLGDRLLLAWVEADADGGSRLRAAVLPLDRLPSPLRSG